MSHRTRNCRRSVVPRLDPLEGRSLLSHAGFPLDALRPDAQAVVSNRDDRHDAPVPRVEVARSASPIDLADAKAEAGGPTAEEVRVEPDAVAESAKENSDPPAVVSVNTFSPLAASSPAAGSSTSPSLVDGNLGVDDSPEQDRRALPTSAASSPGQAVVSTGIVDPIPQSPGRRGSATGETPAPPPRPDLTPGPAEEAEREAATIPTPAGIISRVLPFSGEDVMRAVDELFVRVDDLEILETVESIASQPLVVAAGACFVTLGVVEIARRLRPEDSEWIGRRAHARAMVPSLKLASSR